MKTLSVLLGGAVLMMSLALAGIGQMVQVQVNGLVCDFCARSLEAKFGERPEVASIEVNLDTKIISIALNEGKDIDDATIRATVTDAGYDVVAIDRSPAR